MMSNVTVLMPMGENHSQSTVEDVAFWFGVGVFPRRGVVYLITTSIVPVLICKDSFFPRNYQWSQAAAIQMNQQAGEPLNPDKS